MNSHRIVIVGGGFGGLQAALGLKRADAEITLIDRRNFHLFQPLTYQVATGALSPGEVAYPLRSVFRGADNVRVLLAEVTGFDLVINFGVRAIAYILIINCIVSCCYLRRGSI